MHAGQNYTIIYNLKDNNYNNYYIIIIIIIFKKLI